MREWTQIPSKISYHIDEMRVVVVCRDALLRDGILVFWPTKAILKLRLAESTLPESQEPLSMRGLMSLLQLLTCWILTTGSN